MILINNLTNAAQQQFTLTGIPGVQINVLLRFMPRVQGWFADIAYSDQKAQGIAVVTSPNFLNQWKKIFPFGLACLRADGLDPYTINDFSDQLSSLYLLDSADLATIETALFTQPAA